MCETRRRGAARLGREKKKKGLRRGGRRVCVRCAGDIRKKKHSHKGEGGVRDRDKAYGGGGGSEQCWVLEIVSI